MHYGWFSADQATAVTSEECFSEKDYDDLSRRRMARSGLAVYATADGKFAVVTSMVTSRQSVGGICFDDIVPVGMVKAYMGSLPPGVNPGAPMAVPMADLYRLLAWKLSATEQMEALRVGKVMVDEALALGLPNPCLRNA